MHKTLPLEHLWFLTQMAKKHWKLACCWCNWIATAADTKGQCWIIYISKLELGHHETDEYCLHSTLWLHSKLKRIAQCRINKWQIWSLHTVTLRVHKTKGLTLCWILSWYIRCMPKPARSITDTELSKYHVKDCRITLLRILEITSCVPHSLESHKPNKS